MKFYFDSLAKIFSANARGRSRGLLALAKFLTIADLLKIHAGE